MNTLERISCCLVVCAVGSALSTGCFDNPSWRNDAFSVQGRVQGSECAITIDGVRVPRDTALGVDELMVTIDDAYNIGLPASLGLKSILCNGLQLSIAGPLTALPPTGVFPVAEGMPRPDKVSAALFSPAIGTGSWPFAMNGAYLQGYDGRVEIDSVTKSQAWASFKFRARRIGRGE